MECITSKSNEKVKHIKSLNEKKFRQQFNEYYLEGIKVTNELLDIYEKGAINDIQFIAYSYDILIKLNGGKNIIDRIDKFEKIKKYNIDSNVFQSITDTVNTQGILTVLKISKNSIYDNNFDNNILIIDKVSDAGNLGTIVRTADCFNVNDIICLNGTTDVYSQKALRSTMASILRVNITYLKENELESFIKFLKDKNVSIIGTSLNSNTYINESSIYEKKAFVIGNEANGISDDIIKYCDELIKIPISNTAESLNVAVATGIILYEQFVKK